MGGGIVVLIGVQTDVGTCSFSGSFSSFSKSLMEWTHRQTSQLVRIGVSGGTIASADGGIVSSGGQTVHS
jgi:hypothetical protein